MPIHDWARVDDGVFHDFHTTWIGLLRIALNSGLLPEGYYAMAEQVAGVPGPAVLTLQTPNAREGPDSLPGVLAVTQPPPRVRLTLRPEKVAYTRRQRSLLIRHTSDHRIIALVEIVSAG